MTRPTREKKLPVFQCIIWGILAIVLFVVANHESSYLSACYIPSLFINSSDPIYKESNHYDSLGPISPAHEESNYFFDDIPPKTWELMKQKVQEMSNIFSNRTTVLKFIGRPAGFFYQTFYEPDFVCQNERRIGRLGDGGKWVCDPHRIAKKKDCLVYSVGSNNDFSFETAIFKDIGEHCEVHTFDFGNFTVGAKEAKVNYHMWGISDTDGRNRKGQQLKTLQTTVKDLGHEGRGVDIFKIDCEGCEWASFESFFEANVTLHQILIEFHGVKNPQTVNLFEKFYNESYVTFHKEPNIRFWQFGKAIEYAFLKLTPAVFGR